MSAAKRDGHAKKGAKEPDYQLVGPWAGAWRIFAGVGGLGLAGALAGMAADPRRFAFSWLFAFMTVLAVALGSTFFVLIQRLTGSGWSVTVRRTAEFFSNGLLVMVPLALPFLLNMNHLFPWLASEHGHDEGKKDEHGLVLPALVRAAHAEEGQAPGSAAPHAGAKPAGDHGEGHGSGTGGGTGGGHAAGSGPRTADHASAGGAQGMDHVGSHVTRVHAEHEAHEKIHHRTMAKKAGYLNRSFFLVRAVVYFAIWIFLAIQLFGFSTRQDTSRDPALTLSAQRFAAPATFLFGLSLTFAAFDWIMSLEPTWFSTIFGVYYFATGVVSSLALLILVTMALRDSGPLKEVVTVEHYHDLGKLLFGFNVFWAYIGFSQFMLIWYAALPEETTFFHNRWDFAPWKTVSLVIVLGHFVFPFFWLISRWFKRNLGRLRIGAATLLLAHVIDVYWLVMPNYRLGQEGFSFHWLDVACLLAVAGTYGAFVFFRMTKFPLVPVGDPRLARALTFQNA